MYMSLLSMGHLTHNVCHPRNIVTALWAIAQALGTLLNAGIAEIPMTLKYEFFVYLLLISIVTVVFIVVNRNYQYKASTASGNLKT